MSASSEVKGAGINDWAESKGFISVTPQGMGDNKNSGGPWYSWNAVGTTQSPGPAGATCTSAANYPSYCYNSCQKCKDSPQCDWTTCDETVTPTGTGRANVGGFIPGLYDTLESQLCLDTTREYAAGESNGGMMTYQLGVDLASRLAAIAPQFGSFHRGFAMAPLVGVPVIDTHGTKDTTVPGNVSLSGDGYYYTTTDEIFNGGKYSTGWKKANGCSGSSSTYTTAYDGIQKLHCALEGNCTGGDVVRCVYNGGHNWFNNGGPDNGGLVTDFLLKWKKASHIGGGRSKGEEVDAGLLLSDIKILDHVDEVPMVAADLIWQEDHIEAVWESTFWRSCKWMLGR
jgi:poly(3-hydroxybutyrate) depolymerase